MWRQNHRKSVWRALGDLGVLCLRMCNSRLSVSSLFHPLVHRIPASACPLLPQFFSPSFSLFFSFHNGGLASLRGRQGEEAVFSFLFYSLHVYAISRPRFAISSSFFPSFSLRPQCVDSDAFSKAKVHYVSCGVLSLACEWRRNEMLEIVPFIVISWVCACDFNKLGQPGSRQ